MEWISSAQGLTIEGYMSKHRHDSSIAEMESYFNSVIGWVSGLFEMTDNMVGLEWGRLYEEYHTKPFDRAALNSRAKELLADSSIGKRANIYEYLLGSEEHPELLQIRIFEDSTKKITYQRQTEKAKSEGVSNCPLCAVGNNSNKTRIYKLNEMDADHVTAWSRGGETSLENCEMLCKTHNRAKGNK